MPQRPPHEDEGIYIMHNGQYIHSLPDALPRIIHSPELFQYMKKKRKWDDQCISSICFDRLHGALNKVKSTSRVNMTQLIHNWQHTGYQKKLFHDSATKTDNNSTQLPLLTVSNRSFACPLCHEPVETPLHFVTCPKVVFDDTHKEMRSALLKKLRKLNIYDGIIDIIIYLFRGHPISDYRHTPTNNSLRLQWEYAFESQGKLGWKAFIQGFWHSSWLDVQRIHTQLMPSSQTNDHWMTSTIYLVLQYAYDCWNHRNVAKHGKNDSDEYRAELQHKVRQLYLSPDRYLSLTKEKRRLFNMNLEKRLNCTNGSLETWIDLVELRLRLDREEHSKRTLKRWLDDNKSGQRQRGS